MKKHLAIFFLLVVSSLVFGKTSWAFSVSFDQKISMNGHEVAVSKVKFKDGKMRSDTTVAGTGMTVVGLKNETGHYNYFPAQNIAQKLPATEEDPTQGYGDYKTHIESKGGKKIGEETIDGKELDVYTYVDPVSQQEAQAWVWREKNFPVKVEQNGPDGVTSVEMTNIDFSAPIDDSVFQLAPGTQIT